MDNRGMAECIGQLMGKLVSKARGGSAVTKAGGILSLV